MSGGRLLKLVKFDPNDFNSGSILAAEDESLILRPEEIGAALSLYFEWPDYRKCSISFNRNPFAPALLCEMDYDRDESSPSELKIRILEGLDSNILVPHASVSVKFEVFGTCYKFDSSIGAVIYEHEEIDGYIIVPCPESLKSQKARRLPRTVIENSSLSEFANGIYLSSGGPQFEIPLSFREIGMTSIKAQTEATSFVAGTVGRVKILDFILKCTVVRVEEGHVVFTLFFEDEITLGKYFDYYRRFSYPSLRSRYDYPYKDGVNLYSDSNYFSMFKSTKSDEDTQSLIETWDKIKSGFHKTNADYYITDKEERPIGCSALAISNYLDNKPVWTMHQLCILKSPEYILESGVLYHWRAEYLAAKQDEFFVWGTFRSQSRWLERIYVKHVTNKNSNSSLNPILMKKSKILKTNASEFCQHTKYMVGEVERISAGSEDIWAGVNPKFLNANGNLNFVLALNEVSPETVTNIAQDLVNLSSEESIEIAFVVSCAFDIDKISGDMQVQDRFFKMPKADLLGFIYSVEHSIAVTERKLRGTSRAH